MHKTARRSRKELKILVKALLSMLYFATFYKRHRSVWRSIFDTKNQKTEHHPRRDVRESGNRYQKWR